jgi:sugar (pentulose or hexulose) kinase
MTSKKFLSFILLFQFFFSFSYYHRGVSIVVWSFAYKSKSKSKSKSSLSNKSHYLAGGIGIRGGGGEQGREPTTTMMMTRSPLFVGFDLGTSGARISIIESSSSSSSSDGGFREIYTDSVTWKDCVSKNSNNNGDGDGEAEGRYDNPDSWWTAIETLLEGCCNHKSNIASICVSGTSASCLIVDRTTLEVTRNPRMYDYDIITSDNDNDKNSDNDNDNGHIGLRTSELIQKYLPSKHTARANTSSFAKLIKWILESPLQMNEKLCHQSDYISSKLLFSITAASASASAAMANDNDNDNNEKKKEGVGIQMQIQSDWHNCLKLGYDVRNQCWPSSNTNNNWMELCLREAVRMSNNNYKNNDADIDSTDTNMINKILPNNVVSPGLPLGIINDCVAEKLGLSKDVIIIAGTTDSNAAFFAAAASDLGRDVDVGENSKSSGNNNKQLEDVDDSDITGSSEIRIPYGTAVTSLGSTTAIKFLSKTYVEDSTVGVYSHLFPSRKVFSTTTTTNNNNNDDDENENEEQEAWLVGGASNVGCAVFRALNFTDDELQSRSMDIDPTTDSESYLRYKYYPLLPNKVGERFPIADSTKQSVLEPIPDSGDRTEYLKGLFQSIAEVERKGYDVLRYLGSNPSFPTRIMTSGGGSKNTVWSKQRQRIMNNNNNNIDNNNNAGADGIDVTDKIEIQTAEHAEASYGAALLAAAGFRVQKSKT